MWSVWKSLVVVAVTFVTIAFDLGGVAAGNPCSTPVDTCGECIQLHPSCTWCFDRDLEGNRCGSVVEQLSRGCNAANIETPTTLFNVTRDLPLDMETPTIRPQEAKLRMRKGEEVTMKVEVVMGWNDPFVTFDITSPRWAKVTEGSYCLDFSLSTESGSCGRADNRKQPLVAFDITVKLSQCPPKNSTGPYTILIQPVGHEDFMTIALEPLCSYDCEKPGNVQVGGSAQSKTLQTTAM